MILATYNVENMFERVKAMNLDYWSQGQPILDDFNRLNELIENQVYTDAIKSEMLAIMKRHPGLDSAARKSDYIWLRENHGKLVKNPTGKPPEIRASGRGEWVGWFELEKEPVNGPAIENTARVINLVKPDVLCVVEVENRVALKRFNTKILPQFTAQPLKHIMVIDGNDDRGIDVGIMAKDGYTIIQMLSHVDDTDSDGEIFSRDCAEYEVQTPNGNKLLVLANHLKSKSGDPADSSKKRLRQAKRVREIYDSYIQLGYEYIAIMGDFNSSPTDPSLAPLINSNLVDIMAHSKFKRDQWAGTYGDAYKDDKFDYILMSPKLSNLVNEGGIERRGVWAGRDGQKFNPLPTITKLAEAASDHAALWVDLDI